MKPNFWIVRFWSAVATALIWWDSGFLTALGTWIITSTFMGVHEKLGHPPEGA